MEIKWPNNPYTWPYTSLTGVISPLNKWSLTLLIPGDLRPTNCRFSSYFFGGRFLASLATWFDCHLDAGFHTDGPALRALPKDHLNVGLVGHVCHEGSEEFCLRIPGIPGCFITIHQFDIRSATGFQH